MLEIRGKTYDIVTLDFETFYGDGYTLSGKINTSEYVRDDRFHIHGVGIKINEASPLWYTGLNIGLALHEIDWSKTAMLGHNVPFDGFICSHVFKIIPAFYLDTLAMARATHGHHMRHNLDTIAKAHGLAGKVKGKSLVDTKNKVILTPQESAKLGSYCLDDVHDTRIIFDKMYPNVPDDELRLIDLTTRMFCDPVLRVDIPRVQAELDKEIGGKMAALLISGATAEDLMSNNKFAVLLKREGLNPPLKISPSTGLMTYAFARSDIGFQQLQQHANPKIAALANARIKIKSTIGETRAVRFLEAGKDNMPLPVLLNFSGAHTHRWSGGNKMNLQNLKRGGELRRAILAPEGYDIVVADSAQIEARLLAWLADQADVVAAFANKRDLYSEFASLVFGYPVDRKKVVDGVKIHEMEGFVGKVCVLGLGYGMGWKKFQATLASGAMGMAVKLSEEQCKAAVNLYRTRNHKIRAFWKIMDGVIVNMIAGKTGTVGPLSYGKGYIQLPSGLFLQYYGLHGEAEIRFNDLVVTEATYLTRSGRSKIYGGLLTENVVQALARCVIGEQMLAISDKYRVVTMSHDEIVAVCPKEQSRQCLDDMIQIMSTPPEWAPGLPLFAEGGFDSCYSK